ncbi:MAG: MASE3 domain-containing protein [Planctomycetota bacterium]|nr:MASE3 domain-containing protein [Planctomycetota bacterium]
MHDHRTSIRRIVLGLICWATVLGALYTLSLRRFLLFHSVVEIASVSVAFAIFLIVWNSREFMQNGYMLFLGGAFLFIGALDLIHTLAYKGMGVFPDHGVNLPTQLWIVARYIESLSFLIAPVFVRRRYNIGWVLLAYAVFSCLILLSIFWGLFPACYDDVQGRLTPFKEASEFIIIGILLAALLALFLNRAAFDPRVLRYISFSILVTMVSEFMFTRYTSPYEGTNVVGHLLKIVAFYFVYKALIEIGLREPYNLLYRELKQRQIDLQEAHDDLEARVRQRTAELSQTVETLRNEAQARIRIEQELAAQSKTLEAFFHHSITPLVILDRRFNFIRVNQAYADSCGRAISEFKGHNHFELYPDPDLQQIFEEAVRTKTTYQALAKPFRFEDHPEWGVTYWDWTLVPMLEADGEVESLVFSLKDVTDAKRAEEKILADQGQLRALTAQLLRVEDQERRAIAMELHDSVGQILAFIKIEIGELRRAELPADLAQIVHHIREQVNEAIQQTRTLTFEISPPELYTLGLESALEELTQRFGHERQIECTLHDTDDPKPLSDQMKTLLYRSVRELLVNAAKHANARIVGVTVDRIDDEIQITVEDDGIGFNTSDLEDRSPHRTEGFGLFSIRERLTHMGGTMYIQSTRTQGTKVVLRAPLENSSPQ